jgi:anti-sigma regulatory factor (Ser/Thr protein kinase)
VRLHVHQSLQTLLHLHGLSSKITLARSAPALDSAGFAMMVLRARSIADTAFDDDWTPVLGQAWPAAGRWPSPLTDNPKAARCVLRSNLESPRIARDFTRTTLTEWKLCQILEDATVVVSELVTNALRHGLQYSLDSVEALPIQLVLFRHDRRLMAVVTDPGDEVPARADTGYFAESGRGLHVVEAISHTWGWARLASGGKAVWAAFETR